jgi:hypothetical protein
MNTNRRDFLKLTGFAGLGLGAGLLGCSPRTEENNPFSKNHEQQFNMHGFAAPAAGNCPYRPDRFGRPRVRCIKAVKAY